MYPKVFEDLIECLKLLPGVGIKSAERYAFEIIEWDQQYIDQLAISLKSIKESLCVCKVCGNLSEGELCEICKQKNRDKTLICVVQGAKDVIAIENMREYKGLYHVINGVISTTKGILPDDLNIRSLIPRVTKDINEVIIATNPTVEGETTALYISKLLKNTGVKVSRIAHGIPMGGHLDYADELTLMKALEGRKSMD